MCLFKGTLCSFLFLHSVLIIRTHRVDPRGPTKVLFLQPVTLIFNCLHQCFTVLVFCCWFVAVFVSMFPPVDQWNSVRLCRPHHVHQNQDPVIKAPLHSAAEGENSQGTLKKSTSTPSSSFLTSRIFNCCLQLSSINPTLVFPITTFSIEHLSFPPKHLFCLVCLCECSHSDS